MVRPAVACSLLLAALAAPLPAAKAPKTVAPVLSRMEKLARVAQLEDDRSAGAGELERYVRDADRGIRRRAALAAGRVGDRSLTPALVDLMNDGEPLVRQMAAFALGLAGDPLAVERLVAALKDSDPTTRARAAEALGRIGDPRAAQSLADMVRAALPPNAPVVTVRGDDPGSVQDPWFEPRLGLFALARLERDTAAAEGLMLAGGRSRFDWWAATWVAMRLGKPAFEPVLTAALESSDPLSRAFGARGLGALKHKAAVLALVRLTSDKSPFVALSAVRALARIGDPRGTPAAAALLASPLPALREEALLALAELPPDRGLRSRLVAFVGDREPALRAAALQALAHLDREDFALVLSGLDPDPEWSVRAGLARALGRSGGEFAQGALLAMLEDPDPRVLPAVLEALREARGADAADTLRRQLQHRDVSVRAAAAEGLARLAPEGETKHLAEALKRAQSDAEPDARLALVEALAAQKRPEALQALSEAAAGDPSRLVRERAAAALRAAGQAAPDPGPVGVRRPRADYRQALAPYDPAASGGLFTPRAILHTPRGRIEIHLDVIDTPLTTQAFLDLARGGFYDGLTFHRVVPGFVAQGGDPRGDGNGGPGFQVRDEPAPRPFGRGTVGLALAGRDTGGSQFFIATNPAPQLDGGFTPFGQVVSGLEAVEALRPGDTIEHVEIWDGR